MAEDEQAQAETSALNMLTLVEITFPGEMAEWLKAHAWKACLGETLTWVRIPLSPPRVNLLILNTL